MTTARETWPEPDSAAIAQRLRAYMGDKKISRSKLALAAGIGRTPLGAKLDGEGKFTLDELLGIARALGKHWIWVVTGDDSLPDPSPGLLSPLEAASKSSNVSGRAADPPVAWSDDRPDQSIDQRRAA